MNRRPLTKSRHLTCVAGNYLSLGPSGRRRGNYSSELSGQSELPFGRRQTVQRAGGLPRRSSPGPAEPLTCRRRKVDAHDALPSRRRFCVFWESAELIVPIKIYSLVAMHNQNGVVGSSWVLIVLPLAITLFNPTRIKISDLVPVAFEMCSQPQWPATPRVSNILPYSA